MEIFIAYISFKVFKNGLFVCMISSFYSIFLSKSLLKSETLRKKEGGRFLEGERFLEKIRYLPLPTINQVSQLF